MRYDQLTVLINAHKPTRILEVGTWNGHRAMALAAQALKMSERVHYVGFDLFEDATEETDARELNVKAHNSVADVTRRLEEFKAANEGFTFELHKGDTCQTLPEWVAGAKEATEAAGKELEIDLAFIDGGHSIPTIASDFGNLKDISQVVVLDDFYSLDDNNVIPDVSRFGCNALLEPGEYDVFIMPQADPVAGGGRVQMACWPREAWPENQNIVIKTKNCVPDEQIQANIAYSATLTKHWIEQCVPHGKTAVIVSGGPSYKKQLKKIKKLAKKKDHVLFCVKTSHDFLIEKKIIPWGCLLLDPRPHVLDYVENPHSDIRYFAASMCHPVTLHRLVEAKAKVYGYHAHVGAGEEEAIKKALGGGNIIGGGSTAALRGISVLHYLGFKKFKLFGFDSCYESQDAEVHGFKKEKPIMQVETNGKKFWTDPELLAQAQDFVKLMEVSQDIDLEVIGPGMIAHVWKTSEMKPQGVDFDTQFREDGHNSSRTEEHRPRV